MVPSPVTSNPTHQNASLVECLHVLESAVAIASPADVKKAEELEVDETDVIAFSKEKNWKALMCVGKTSNILKLMISIFNIGSGPNVVRSPCS